MKSLTTETKKPLSKWTRSPEWGLLPPALIAAVLLCLALLWSGQSQAYSYAEAGAEPLLNARQQLLAAVMAGDDARAGAVLAGIRDEVDLLDVEFSTLLLDALEEAVLNRDVQRTKAMLDAAFALEIRRRLNLAGKQLDDYQSARILVAKSRAYLAPLKASMSPEARQAAEAALEGCLQAVGQPGVLGAGKVPPNPEAFRKHQQRLEALLDRFVAQVR